MAIAVPFIGAAIGSAIGGTFLGVAAASWGWLAGSLLASALFRPPNQRGPLLEDRVVSGTAYGQAIPAVYGSPRLAGQYVWASEVRPIANTQKVGKGGGQKVTTFTYEVDLMIMLSENTTVGVARDWLNGELVRNGLTVKDGIWTGITVYTGADDQMPDPTYEAAVGAGNASAFRGLTTIMVRGLQLGGGKQLPNLEHQAVHEGETFDEDDFQDYSGNDVPVVQDSFIPIDNKFNGTTDVVAKFGFSGEFLGGNAITPGKGLLAFDETGDGAYEVGGEWFRNIPGEFSIRAWLYDTGDGAVVNHAFAFGNDNGIPPGLWAVRRSTAFSEVFRVSYRGVPDFELETAAATPKNQWFYFEVTKRGDDIFLFIDGVLEATDTSTRTDFPCHPSQLSIGSRYGFAPAWSGYIDDFVYTDGQDGHVANYTPPTSPHVPDAGTLLYIPFNRPDAVTPGAEPLDIVIDQLMVRAGYDTTEFEVAPSLSNVELYGYQTGDITNTRAHLEVLRPFGKYESYCTDKIYVFARATTPAGTIDWDDLGASEGLDPMDPFVLDAGNENEMPAQIVLRYRNVSADYNVGTEFSDRIRSSQDSTQTVDMPFGMTPAQAKSTVESLLLDMMAGLGRVSLSTGGRKYAKYNPGDVITTTNPAGRTYRLRILTKRDSLIRIEFECVLDDASVLNPPDTTYEGYVSNETPARVPPTEWEVVNIPPLRDADAEATGPYIALTPARESASDDWPGAVFVRARLPEAYEQVFISGDESVIGETTTVLADYAGNSGTMQTTGKVRVEVRGELSSSTWADFFVDRTINACVFGNEPCRFLIAEFISTDGILNTYDLSLLMRGQLGQEHEMVEHPIGTRFVLLNNAIRKMTNETTDIDVEQQVKAVTLNTLLSAVDADDFTDSGIALKPYSPWVLRALRDGSDIEVTWGRRSRRVARYTTAGVNAPLGELVEAYRLKVYDGVTLVRTENLTSPAYIYAAADITSDGFAPGDPITITVQQLSDTVGEGFATTVETAAP